MASLGLNTSVVSTVADITGSTFFTARLNQSLNSFTVTITPLQVAQGQTPQSIILTDPAALTELVAVLQLLLPQVSTPLSQNTTLAQAIHL